MTFYFLLGESYLDLDGEKLLLYIKSFVLYPSNESTFGQEVRYSPISY